MNAALGFIVERAAGSVGAPPAALTTLTVGAAGMADGTITVPTKICVRCKAEKPATFECFYRCKDRRDGLHSACKPCIYRPLGRRRRPVSLLKQCTKCRDEKPATAEFFCLKETGVGGLYSICKVCDATRAATGRIGKQPDRRLALFRTRLWRDKNPEHAREIYRRQQKRRRKDGRYRASASISGRIRKSLTGKGGVSWEKLVGYTRRELVIHLERQFAGRMSWGNYGRVWHIDHIRPVSIFNFFSYADRGFRDCWALANLRPLLKRDNLIKRDHLTHLI